MSNEPSLLRIQPSKNGTTSWPELNLVCGIAVGKFGCALATPAKTSTNATATSLLIRLLRSRRDALLVIRLLDVEETHPREAHLVDRPLAVADPVARVRVVLVRRGVVVPRGDMDDRPRGQNRRDVVLVRIGDVPAELICAHAIYRLGSGGAGAI